jgi:3-methyladenine DNA glycosylase Tag
MTPDSAKSLANDILCAVATLQAVANELMTAYPDSDYTPDVPELQEEIITKPKIEKAVTLEDVRSVLSTLSANGKRAEVKELLGKFGVTKLSDVKKEDYSALLENAEVLQ